MTCPRVAFVINVYQSNTKGYFNWKKILFCYKTNNFSCRFFILLFFFFLKNDSSCTFRPKDPYFKFYSTFFYVWHFTFSVFTMDRSQLSIISLSYFQHHTVTQIIEPEWNERIFVHSTLVSKKSLQSVKELFQEIWVEVSRNDWEVLIGEQKLAM